MKISNPAYTQKPQVGRQIEAKYRTKHERYLALLETMMREGITRRLKQAHTYEEAFNALVRPPLYEVPGAAEARPKEMSDNCVFSAQEPGGKSLEEELSEL